MTQVLDKIRRIDEAHARGDITDARYAELRRDAREMVEEAEVAEGPAPAPKRNETADLLNTSLLILCGLAMLTVVVAVLTQDVMLAVTLSVVLLAGVVINAGRKLIAEDQAEAKAKSARQDKPVLDTYDDKGRAVPAE